MNRFDVLNYISTYYFFNHISVSWMGGSYRGHEGVWRWETSGSRLTYTNWYPGQPDNGGGGQDCLSMWDYDGRWWGGSCHSRYRYICESVWFGNMQFTWNIICVNQCEFENNVVQANCELVLFENKRQFSLIITLLYASLWDFKQCSSR